MSPRGFKKRLRLCRWLFCGLFRWARLRDLGRIAVWNRGGYEQAECSHCDGPLYGAGIVQIVPVPATVRGIRPRVRIAEFASFCMRCGHGERLALAADQLAAVNDAIGPIGKTFNVVDLIETMELSETFRQKVITDEIRLHEKVIAELRKAPTLGPMGPYRTLPQPARRPS